LQHLGVVAHAFLPEGQTDKDAVGQSSCFSIQYPVSGVASNALTASGKTSSSIETSLEVSKSLSHRAVNLDQYPPLDYANSSGLRDLVPVWH
jgi:hypothetical protein